VCKSYISVWLWKLSCECKISCGTYFESDDWKIFFKAPNDHYWIHEKINERHFHNQYWSFDCENDKFIYGTHYYKGRLQYLARITAISDSKHSKLSVNIESAEWNVNKKRYLIQKKHGNDWKLNSYDSNYCRGLSETFWRREISQYNNFDISYCLPTHKSLTKRNNSAKCN
jgi:hypothetical protein